MTGIAGRPGRPGRKPKQTANSLEQEIKEAQKRLDILRRQEAGQLRQELDHARFIAGLALIEAVARGTWTDERIQRFETQLGECVSRESDQKAVRRAFLEGRRLFEERGGKADPSQAKVPRATTHSTVSRGVSVSQGA